MPVRPDPRPSNRIVRAGWLALGLVCVGLGVIGAILPLMPTTIFLILAAGCFARSSPRLEAWLLNHRRFGPTLRAWRADGAIPRNGKIAACCGITLGFALFMFGAHPHWKLWLPVAVLMAGCALYIVSRPSPGTSRLND
jgi:uncharacterized membrane protein YbaN (DUF454 family)